MKRRVEDWSVEKLHKARAKIAFPEYQRQDRLWPDDKKQLLIDSILKDIDIPKLYFNRTRAGEFEVVDGQQRLWAIWEFLDGVYGLQEGQVGGKFSELPTAAQKSIREYSLQVTVFEEADDDYLRELFLRLQLGLLLVTGEKLNAATGAMKEFVFDELAELPFIAKINIPKRRYAKQTLCAQIAINSFTRAKNKQFARTRYEDLLYFFQEYERPQGSDLDRFEQQTRIIAEVLDDLDKSFGARSKDLANRSYILSIYLVFEDLRVSLTSREARHEFVDFVFKLWSRLRAEMSAGFDRKNRELYVFETKLSSAPGERYQIERRHQLLVEYFVHYQRTGKIKGDE
jgi:uncharacterized protein DUF262